MDMKNCEGHDNLASIKLLKIQKISANPQNGYKLQEYNIFVPIELIYQTKCVSAVQESLELLTNIRGN